MRYATGELPDRLHFLRLGKLNFKVLLLGHINEMQSKPTCGVGLAGRRAIRSIIQTAQEQHHGLFTWPLWTDLHRLGIRAPLDSCCELGGDALSILLVQKTD